MFCPRCRTHTTVRRTPIATTAAVPEVPQCRECGTRLVTPAHE